MAWNPSPEVAVARDAAERLGNADQVVVVWLDRRKGTIGMASYGRNTTLCREAKELGDAAYNAVLNELEERNA